MGVSGRVSDWLRMSAFEREREREIGREKEYESMRMRELENEWDSEWHVWIWFSTCVNEWVSKWKCVDKWVTELLRVRISDNE